uniref:USP domain-containing protein n=1 Tax=Rhizophora mucronata TaxID=61149 RepID=A0A2P2M9A2_RHIMU
MHIYGMYFLTKYKGISRNFRNARQEDAHEYMVNLLESMHKCCLPLGVPSESPAAYEKSLVHKIFGGRLRSQVECQQCLYGSNKFDPFLDLSLEIVKADSLPVALRNFTAAEMLDGGEKHYQCQQCKQRVRATKRLTVHKVPYVLTIHLKRFHAHDPGRKVDKKVLFDSSLDMKPFVSDFYDGNLKYSLYGVLVHYGHNTHSGHYVCFVRTSSGMWYLLNDNEVRQVREKHVLEQEAYMLFYVRDRKNVALKKPIDVVQKENIKSSFHNNANLVHKSFLKENSSCLVNGSTVTGYSATYKKDAWNVGPVKETFAKEASSQHNNEAMIPECSVPKHDPDLGPPSCAPLLKDMSKSDTSGSPGGISTERAAGDISDEQSGDFSQGIAHELVISSMPLVVPNECSVGEASESGQHKKLKKKLIKNQILRRHVGSNLFRASLGLWKKKKHKKNKKHILGTWNLMKEQLLDGSFPSDSGPSTSKASVSSVNSLMKGVKSVLEKGASPRMLGTVPVGDIINGELSKRNNQAAENGNRDTSQEGMMGIVVRDAVDTGVARWDGIVLPPSDTAEPIIAQNVCIGYVPDEWDEEYDRGKRKKLRHSKHNFGGPNPFQEIATKKTQFKKANINRASRGNQPFWI